MSGRLPDLPDHDCTATVSARGDALVRAAPDEADLWIALSALEPAPADALADVTRRAADLAALLDELSIAPPDRSIGGISVHEEFDHSQDGRRSLGYRAMANASIRATDAALIGRLITEATERLHAQISGPHWHVSPSNPARLHAARNASADARQKAEAFAEGLGARLGPILRVLDTTDMPPAVDLTMRLSQSRVRRPAGQEPGAPIEPGEHDVASSVQVTFALEQT